jgi:hypothetical protein
MCINCGNTGCNCAKDAQIKYTSQIIYDGDKQVLLNAGITIEKCDTLNDIIVKLANKIEELSTP